MTTHWASSNYSERRYLRGCNPIINFVRPFLKSPHVLSKDERGYNLNIIAISKVSTPTLYHKASIMKSQCSLHIWFGRNPPERSPVISFMQAISKTPASSLSRSIGPVLQQRPASHAEHAVGGWAGKDGTTWRSGFIKNFFKSGAISVVVCMASCSQDLRQMFYNEIFSIICSRHGFKPVLRPPGCGVSIPFLALARKNQ